MRLTIAKKDLQRLLTTASKAVADEKTPIPWLSQIYLLVRGGRLRCEGTNMNGAVFTEAPISADHPFEQGAILVPCKDTLARVAAMPEGLVDFETKGDQGTTVIIQARDAKRRFQIHGLSADLWGNQLRFPEANLMTLPATTLLKLIDSVEYAVSHDETRAHVNSALLTWQMGALMAVATDGHRLALLKLPVEGLPPPTGKPDVLIRKNDLKLFKRLLEQALHDPKATVSFGHTANVAALSVGDVQSVVKLTDSTFPPWMQATPRAWKRRFLVDRLGLLEAVKCVQLAGREMVFLSTDEAGREVVVETTSPESGDARDTVPISGSPRIDPGYPVAFKMKMDPAYVREMLESFDTEQILMCIVGDGRDELFIVRGDEQALVPHEAPQFALCMPMKS